MQKVGKARAFVTRTLVGQRIGVFWEGEKEYYYGSILEMNESTGKCFVHFDDGEECQVDLKKERWMLLDVPGQLNPEERNNDYRSDHQRILDSEIKPVLQGDCFTVFPTCSGTAGYEIFALFPGHDLSNVSVTCHHSGKVSFQTTDSIDEEPKQPVDVELPSRIKASSAHAIYSERGQLYIRVDIAD